MITQTLEDGIRSFQRRNDLKEDGKILPRGETENALRLNLKEKRTESIPPIPQHKPTFPATPKPEIKPNFTTINDGDKEKEILDELKKYKHLWDFVRKGPKGGPLFLWDLFEKLKEIEEDDRVI